jgi:hypothetical protein
MRERISDRGGNPADLGPGLERTPSCGLIFTGGDVVTAEMVIYQTKEMKLNAERREVL